MRGNKYHARRTPCRQGQTHASAGEARRCNELDMLQRTGCIAELVAHPQPAWPLVVNGVKVGRYTADFTYQDKASGRRIVEDFKGGPVSRDVPLRLKLMKALYGIDVLLTGRR